MKTEKILVIKCGHCGATNGAWVCDEGAAAQIGLSVIAAANRGDIIEIIDSSSDGIKIKTCDCEIGK